MLSSQNSAKFPTGDGTQQQQPTQIIFVPTTTSNSYDKYKQEHSKAIGTSQIIIGLFLIIFNIVALVYRDEGPSRMGGGLWSGVCFIITGSFGVSAGVRKSRCKIITFMVLCIVSAAMTIIVFIFGILSAFVADSNPRWGCRVYEKEGGNYNYDKYTLSEDCIYWHKVHLAMGACLAIFVFFGAIASIWGSALCCKALCCGAEATAVTGVLYQADANSQLTMIGHQLQTGQIQYAPAGQVLLSQVQQPEMQPGLSQPTPSPDVMHRGGNSYYRFDDSMEKPLIK